MWKLDFDSLISFKCDFGLACELFMCFVHFIILKHSRATFVMYTKKNNLNIKRCVILCQCYYLQPPSKTEYFSNH